MNSDRQDAAIGRDWWLGPGVVIQEKRTGEYHHVRDRFLQIDTGERYYRIADGTHTQYWTYWEGDLKADYDPAGICLSRKPASVFGDRVGGVLRGRNENWGKEAECK